LSGRSAAEPGVCVSAGAYSLLFRSDRSTAVLEDAGGKAWADLFLAASADAESQDWTEGIGAPIRHEFDGRVRVTVPLEGGRWRSKAVLFDCFHDRLEIRLQLRGEGRLTDVHLLGGRYSGSLRHGSGFFRSAAHFDRVFNPEPSRAELWTRPAFASTVIDVMGTSVPGSEHWFSTPAPFCYAMAQEQTGPWMSLGVATEPGSATFTGFHYDALEDAFSVRLAYEGQTCIEGEWTSPALVLRFGAPDPYTALELYVLGLESAGLAPARGRIDGPTWWARPIFCGWGAQSHLASLDGGHAAAFSKQTAYDSFLASLKAHGLEPGTVVIDDKWQSAYGTGEVDTGKWPNLKAWIADRHAAGQKVLLWWKAWDAEGLEPDLCVRDSAGRPVAVDPSHPGYRDSIARRLLDLLGPDGLDADGLKVDFTARTPSGPGLTRRGAQWGVELLYQLMRCLYDASKAAKNDALVITHTPNPYFRDVTDMLRLNDVNMERPVVDQMRHRARIATLACPDALIDTDNWPMPDRASWRDYVAVQAELGVPSLYYATHVDTSGEELDAGDYAAVADSWSSAPR
jgi:hypothetical protein